RASIESRFRRATDRTAPEWKAEECDVASGAAVLAMVPESSRNGGEILSSIGAGADRGVLRPLVLLGLYAIPALGVVRPVVDNDIWMNLKAGQWIVSHAAVPATDPFLSHGEARPWVAYSWLFEVLVHGLDAALGLAGVVLYRIVLSYAVLVAIHRLVARR